MYLLNLEHRYPHQYCKMKGKCSVNITLYLPDKGWCRLEAVTDVEVPTAAEFSPSTGQLRSLLSIAAAPDAIAARPKSRYRVTTPPIHAFVKCGFRGRISMRRSGTKAGQSGRFLQVLVFEGCFRRVLVFSRLFCGELEERETRGRRCSFLFIILKKDTF